MQDRYAGDIGDYGKIGLLRCLQVHGFSIGVNWYRVPELDIEKNKDGTFKQNDGKYTISSKIAQCDPILAEKLNVIADGERSVVSIQNENLIPGAVYFDDYLTVDGRSEWCERAKNRFADVDLIFMDPDNGLLVDSVGKYSTRSVKYAFYKEEVKEYIDSGKSVLVYNHRCRKPKEKYFHDIEDKIEKEIKVYRQMVQKITFPKGTTRDYFAIPACEEHYKMFHEAFADMKNSSWGQRGVCRLYPEDADAVYMRYMTCDDHMFVDVESQCFKENSTLEEYRQDVIRYLMVGGYQYSEELAISLADRYTKVIKKSYFDRLPVADLAIDIGYTCG